VDSGKRPVNAASIIAAARGCLGTPFRHQGRVKGVGVDCAGLCVWVARELGLDHYDVDGYGRIPAGGEFGAHLDAMLEQVPAPTPGGILFMTFGGEPQHVAIYTDCDTIIHATSELGKVVEHRLDDLWRSRVFCCYKFREVA